MNNTDQTPNTPSTRPGTSLLRSLLLVAAIGIGGTVMIVAFDPAPNAVRVAEAAKWKAMHAAEKAEREREVANYQAKMEAWNAAYQEQMDASDAAQAANAKACAESPACVAKAKQLDQAEREQAQIVAYRLQNKADKPLNLN